jgi:hypothetical protein
MTLQMLRMKVGLSAVRAREFAISILDGDHGILVGASPSSRSGRSTRGAGQDATAALRSNNMCGLLAIGKHRVGLHHRVGAIRRRDSRLRHQTAGRHRSKHGRATATSRSRSNGLRVRRSGGSLRHHRGRGAIRLMGWIGVLRRHGVDTASARTLGGLLLVTWEIVGRVWRVWSPGSARCMRVATVERLHGWNGGLKGRERLRKRRARLQLVWSNGCRRRVGVRRRSRVYTIGRRVVIMRAVHAIARRGNQRTRELWSRARAT